MEYVVDVQGFKTSLNEFIFKEVAIVPLEEDAIPSVYLFKPPFRWDLLLDKNKSENKWLERNFHGIPWVSGDIPYEEVSSTFRAILWNVKAVYIKGEEKSKWLRMILPNRVVQNIEEMGCPSLKKLTSDPMLCTHHTKNRVCAVKNALALKKWMMEKRKMELNDNYKNMYS